jgi:hypothetical protein
MLPGDFFQIYETSLMSAGFRDRSALCVHDGKPVYLDLSPAHDDRLTVNVQLELGQLAETVGITTPISGINTNDFSLTGSVSRFQIENLPLNGRNFLELARLEPGVSVTSAANPGAFANNFQRVSVAGAQYLETGVKIDGSTVDDQINGGTALNVSQESVQEFQISSFNADERFAGSRWTDFNNVLELHQRSAFIVWLVKQRSGRRHDE